MTKMIVDHGLSDTQRKLLGVGLVYFGSAFYNLCYCIFYIVMNKFAEYESLPTNYTSAVYIGAACCYFVLGSVAMSATRKKPSTAPLGIDRQCSFFSCCFIVAVIIITCVDLGRVNSEAGFITHRGLLDICPKQVYIAATTLLLIVHISVAYIYIWQRCLEKKMIDADRWQQGNYIVRTNVRTVPAVHNNYYAYRVPVVVRY